jgi:hypothetical protein
MSVELAITLPSGGTDWLSPVPEVAIADNSTAVPAWARPRRLRGY